MRMAVSHVWFPRTMPMLPHWARGTCLVPETGPKGAWSGEVDTDTREVVIRIRAVAGDAKSARETYRMGLEGMVYRVIPTGKLAPDPE